MVTVVAREDDETFEVSPEEEKALLAAIAQAERGEVISWEELRGPAAQSSKVYAASRFPEFGTTSTTVLPTKHSKS